MTPPRLVKTPPCRSCGKVETFEVTIEQSQELGNPDRHIQDIIPGVDAGIREMLISRTCPTCWDKLFEGMED